MDGSEMGTVKREESSSTGSLPVAALVTAGLLLVLNLAVVHIGHGWDLSKGRVHTLDAAARAVLGEVRKPIKVTVFNDRTDAATVAILERFRRANGRISFELVDPEQDPARAESCGATKKGMAAVECRGVRRLVPFVSEQTLTGAIAQVAKMRAKGVLFTAGHGERSIKSGEDSGIRTAARILEAAGYGVAQDRVTAETLAKAAAVVIAGPKQDFAPEESERLLRFVRAGGGLLVLLEPPPATGLQSVLAPYGIRARDDLVIERSRDHRYGELGPTVSYVRSYCSDHPIGARMQQTALLPLVRSLELGDAARKADCVVALCSSSADSSGGLPNSWGETDLNQNPARWDSGRDLPGPLALIAATRPDCPSAGKGKVVIAGTTSFALNRYIRMLGNAEVFEASVSWLAGDLEYPVLPPSEQQEKMVLSDRVLDMILVVSVFLLPGLAALAGLLVFAKRVA